MNRRGGVSARKLGWVLLFLLTACSTFPDTTSPRPDLLSTGSQSITQTPFQPIVWTAEPETQQQDSSASNTPDTPVPQAPDPQTTFSIYLDPNLPLSFRQQLRLPNNSPTSDDSNSASLKVSSAMIIPSVNGSMC